MVVLYGWEKIRLGVLRGLCFSKKREQSREKEGVMFISLDLELQPSHSLFCFGSFSRLKPSLLLVSCLVLFQYRLPFSGDFV